MVKVVDLGDGTVKLGSISVSRCFYSAFVGEGIYTPQELYVKLASQGGIEDSVDHASWSERQKALNTIYDAFDVDEVGVGMTTNVLFHTNTPRAIKTPKYECFSENLLSAIDETFINLKADPVVRKPRALVLPIYFPVVGQDGLAVAVTGPTPLYDGVVYVYQKNLFTTHTSNFMDALEFELYTLFRKRMGAEVALFDVKHFFTKKIKPNIIKALKDARAFNNVRLHAKTREEGLQNCDQATWYPDNLYAELPLGGRRDF